MKACCPKAESGKRTAENTIPRPAARSPQHTAFTLVELLVVISIMGLLAALAVPALKNLGKSNAQASATRQMLDDIGRARQLAISRHTTVYMVFVTTNFWLLPTIYGSGHTVQSDVNNSSYFATPADQQAAMLALTNLVDKQLTGYNFVSFGKVGDQPGQHEWHYLDDWKSLPDGTFIAAAKFQLPNNYSPIVIQPWQPSWLPQPDYAGQIDGFWRPNGISGPSIYAFTNCSKYIPFPTAKSPGVLLPCLAFDHTGKLISEAELDSSGNFVKPHHAYIPLAHGSVGYGYDGNKQPTLAPVLPPAITETLPGNSTNISYNVIDVDPLSGRAKLLVHQLP